MMGIDLGALVPDPDAVTLDDIDENLGELHAKLDWLHAALQGLAAKLPGKFTPELPDWPS